VRIVPVIDLQGGLVVRGVAGRREEYRPIVSDLASEPTPRCVAEALARQFGFREVYIADLDAIASRHPPDFASYDEIASCGLSTTWIDAGARSVSDAARFAQAGSMIIGMESLDSSDDLSAVVAQRGRERTVFSLDLKDGVPITRIPSWQAAPPDQIVAEVVSHGIGRLIVLDLADVGTSGGTRTLNLVRRLRSAHPQLEITAGGGVRSRDDLLTLATAGCDVALVASALHDRRLTPDDVQWLERST
jgi:phosphoribosylformimino-5-aminoimidazole carboxamide ribotide isomerase